MRIDIITLFPDMFTGPLSESILKRAIAANKVTIHLHQLRDYATDKHGTVDDTPYGGGAGMVLKVDVMDAALSAVIGAGPTGTKPYIVAMSAQGRVLKQAITRELVAKDWIILLCGHYEGFDERILSLVDDEISIGDYVLTGGELPAAVLVDSVVRLLPGVLGKEASHQDESHENGLLEYPHYTRPDEYKGMAVPDILKSGNHAAIEQWRREQSVERTEVRRPDLLNSTVN